MSSKELEGAVRIRFKHIASEHDLTRTGAVAAYLPVQTGEPWPMVCTKTALILYGFPGDALPFSTCTALILAEEGSALGDLEAARAEACASAREPVIEDIRGGRTPGAWRISDSTGAVVEDVQLEAARKWMMLSPRRNSPPSQRLAGASSQPDTR